MTEQQMKWIVAAALVGLLLLLGIILVTYIQYRILRAAVKNGMIAGYEELAARRARQKMEQISQERIWSDKSNMAQKTVDRQANSGKSTKHKVIEKSQSSKKCVN